MLEAPLTGRVTSKFANGDVEVTLADGATRTFGAKHLEPRTGSAEATG